MSDHSAPFSLVEHLPVLQVVIPLMAGPLAALSRNKTAAWALATLVSWASLAMAVVLVIEVGKHGEIVYEIGGWAAPWGIEYRIDHLNSYVLVIITAIASVVLPYSRRSVEDEIPPENRHLFFAAMMLCMAGLLGMTATGDAFNVFVFLEISSLSSYVLISMGRSRRSLFAAYQYLVAGTIGGSFILIGIGLCYQMTGTLNMADLAERLEAVESNRAVLAAFAFFSVGVAIKLALFPLHNWLPNAYTYAPAAVTAFLASTATKVIYYILLRVVFTLFGFAVVFDRLNLDAALLPLGLIAAFVGSIVAIYQNNVKRMLAWSSLAQIGYMVIGLSFGTVTGLTGGIVHLLNHGLMKGALFLSVGCVLVRVGSVHIDDFAGLGRRMPLTMFAFVLGGLSLIGVPLTVGFVSKWYLVLAAIESGMWPVAVLMVLSSLLAVVYVWRVVEVAYFRPPPVGAPEVKEAPLSMLIPTWILVGATVWFGVDASTTAGLAAKAAAQLLGVAP